MSFIQLFDTLITDNSCLSNIQKLIYSKSFLRNELLNLIDSLKVTNDNFIVAKNILKGRYENKLAVINSHFFSFFDIEPLPNVRQPP